MTLHNIALMNMDVNPTDGFHKLNFLLQSPPFPPETFGNLLLLYCKPQHAFYDLARVVDAVRPPELHLDRHAVMSEDVGATLVSAIFLLLGGVIG